MQTDSINFIKFSNIRDSLTMLLLNIFDDCKNNAKELNTSFNESININYHEFKDDENYENEIFAFRSSSYKTNTTFSCSKYTKLNKTKLVTKERFEKIDFSQMNFNNLSFCSNILPPNKATQYEYSSHGSIVDMQRVIKSFIERFTNLDIFKRKTKGKIPEYSVEILVDASSIVRNFSLNHCYLSIISLLLSFKAIEIPCVNLVVAGSEIMPLLVNQNLKYIPNYDEFYSKLYSVLNEKSSESRSLCDALKSVISHSLKNPIPHVLFIITDAILGKEQEKEIKNILSFIEPIQSVIGIGTGPAPYRIKDLFSSSVWSKNPYSLRQALLMLFQSPTRNNEFPILNIPKDLPNIKDQIMNSDILSHFAKIPFINLLVLRTINQDAFDRTKLKGDYMTNSNFDANKNDAYKGYRILIMMFYQGKEGTCDDSITVESFIKGPKMMPKDTKSPGDKFREKGFEYDIVTTYKDALTKLTTIEYSIAMICTASTGEEKDIEDENYFESFLEAIKLFHLLGGALVLFGENPPFIFEINKILEILPGITVRVHDHEFDEGGGTMIASTGDELNNGEFRNCEYNVKGVIGGMEYDLPSLGGGLEQLFEGKTLAKLINVDDSFQVFSKTRKGNKSCIFRIPKGNEGVLIIDIGCSKIFNEYLETGQARYINNLAMACIHYSNLRNTYNNYDPKGFKVVHEIKPKRSTLFLKKIQIYPPLLISIIIDATGSMINIYDKCMKRVKFLLDECKKLMKNENTLIYLQFVAYRDIHDMQKAFGMISKHDFTQNPDEIANYMNSIDRKEGGGNDGPENISAGYETALSQIELFKESNNIKYCHNVFIHIGDAPNQDPTINESDYKSGNQNNIPWNEVWKNIDNKMKNLEIKQLITISCGSYFDKQFKIWNNYKCDHINSIMKKYKISENQSFETIFANIPKIVSLMYDDD